MFCVPRIVVYARSLRCLAKNHRVFSSDSTSHLPTRPSSNETTAEGCNDSQGYGEKEIFLLNPVDVRTPLPGNTGIAPHYMLYNYKDPSFSLPNNAEKKSDLITSELPAERHRNVLAQLDNTEEIEQSYHGFHSPSDALECVAQECPELLKKDFSDLFPERNLNVDNLTVITLCQKTKNDMSVWSATIEMEREELIECFVATAQDICSVLKESGFWADFIDPLSGRPFSGPCTSSTMMETDIRYRHFGFIIEDLGCCKVISHHLWGTHAFVGCLFTNAPLNTPEVKSILGTYSKPVA